jgi:hypothetical protein
MELFGCTDVLKTGSAAQEVIVILPALQREDCTMDRRNMLASLGLVTLAAFASADEPAPKAKSGLKGVPAITVEELAAAIRKEGFQWRFIGRQITFTGVVLNAGEAPRVRIDGMDKDKLDTAVIHNTLADNRLQAGDRVRARALIVDQWYGVWQVWKYEITLVKAEP